MAASTVDAAIDSRVCALVSQVKKLLCVEFDRWQKDNAMQPRRIRLRGAMMDALAETTPRQLRGLVQRTQLCKEAYPAVLKSTGILHAQLDGTLVLDLIKLRMRHINSTQKQNKRKHWVLLSSPDESSS